MKPQDARADSARAFAIEAARLAANTRCHNVVLMDVRELSPVTDFFVLASGTSARQMRTVVDEIEEMGAAIDQKAIARSGYEGESWIVLDFVDVIVHVFSDEARMFYDLDNLWGDAKRIAWQPEGAAQPAVQSAAQGAVQVAGQGDGGKTGRGGTSEARR